MLYEAIRSGRRLEHGESRPEGKSAAADRARSTPPQAPQYLIPLQLRLVQMQRQLQEALDMIELVISRQM
jgi:hypothetical protein